MSRTLRVVAYAVNGTGLGHLTRLIAISRWIRRYAEIANVNAEIYFLTSSEADGALFEEKLASFKLPSKTAVTDAGIDKITYLALAKQWVWHSIGLLRPDLLLVDTFPRGSFGELPGVMDLCKKKAFVFRPTKEAFSSRAEFQAMLALYDLIVVPEHEKHATVEVPESVRSRVRYVGPVAARDKTELHSREAARAWFGVPTDRLCVYVSAGGGGDAGADAHLHAVCNALMSDASLHLVVGAGPLYRGRPVYGDRVSFVTGNGIAARANAFDLAITAAGYNTVTELMQAGVPTIFLPQEKIVDDQAARAARCVRAGAARLLDSLDAECIRSAVDAIRAEDVRAQMSAAAKSAVPRTHARDAAAELLRLVLPAHVVDAAEHALDDRTMNAMLALDVATTTLAAMMRSFEPRDGEPGALSSDAVAHLAILAFEFAHSLGVSHAIALRIAERLARKLPGALPEERAKAFRVVLPALGEFSDWDGASAFVHALAIERQLTAPKLADEIAKYLAYVRAEGSDLYAAALHVARGANDADAPPGNARVLARNAGAKSAGDPPS